MSIAFEVKDMSCGHCVSTIARALKAVDPGARLQIDLATHRVRIDAAMADAGELGDAIREAGYTPVALADAAGTGMPDRAPGSSCCCR